LFSFFLMGIQGACGAVQERLRRVQRFNATTSRFNGLRPFNAAEPRSIAPAARSMLLRSVQSDYVAVQVLLRSGSRAAEPRAWPLCGV
jgi:hypothetical protein